MYSRYRVQLHAFKRNKCTLTVDLYIFPSNTQKEKSEKQRWREKTTVPPTHSR